MIAGILINFLPNSVHTMLTEDFITPIFSKMTLIISALFAACGIPYDVYPLAIIFGTILANVFPASNGYNIQLELLMTAKKLNKIDDRLYKESGKPMKRS